MSQLPCTLLFLSRSNWLERLSCGCAIIRVCVELHVGLHVEILLAFLKGNWMSSSGWSIGVTGLEVSVTGISVALGPFLEVSICRVASALVLKPGNASMLEFSIFSHWKFCGTVPGLKSGCVSVLSAEYLFRKFRLIKMLVASVNVPVSINFSFPCRNWFPRKIDIFSMSRSVDSSFPYRSCFPRKNGVLSMPGGNSACLKVKSGKMLCVGQLCSEVLS